MTMEQLQAICASVKIPVVAIGGICLDNIEKLQGSGAAGAAIVSGIFAAEDIEGTTRALRQKMERIIQTMPSGYNWDVRHKRHDIQK